MKIFFFQFWLFFVFNLVVILFLGCVRKSSISAYISILAGTLSLIFGFSGAIMKK